MFFTDTSGKNFSDPTTILNRIEVPGPTDSDFAPSFGRAIAAHRNVLVIGAPTYIPRSGSVAGLLPPFESRGLEEGAVYLLKIDPSGSSIQSPMKRIVKKELEGKLSWFGFSLDMGASLKNSR